MLFYILRFWRVPAGRAIRYKSSPHGFPAGSSAPGFPLLSLTHLLIKLIWTLNRCCSNEANRESSVVNGE